MTDCKSILCGFFCLIMICCHNNQQDLAINPSKYYSINKAIIDSLSNQTFTIDDLSKRNKVFSKADSFYYNIKILSLALRDKNFNLYDSIISYTQDTNTIVPELITEIKLLKAMKNGVEGKFHQSDSSFIDLLNFAKRYFNDDDEILLKIREKHAEMWRYDANSPDEAMKILEVLDTILDKIPNFTKFHRTQLYTQATTYRVMGKFDEALSKALILREKVAESKTLDSTFYFSVSKVLANIYTDMEDPKEANKYFQEQLEYNKRKNRIKAHDLINFAIQLSRNYEFDKASVYLDQALPMLKTSEDSFFYNRTVAYHLMNLERNYAAIPYLVKVRTYCKSKQDFQLCTICTQWLGEAYDLTERPDSALFYYDDAIKYICGKSKNKVSANDLLHKKDIELYFSMVIRAYISKYKVSKNEKYLIEAIKYSDLIQEYFDKVSIDYSGIDKLINFQMFHEAFGHGAYAHYLIWERSKDSKHLLDMFNLLEKCKSTDWDSKQIIANANLSELEKSKIKDLQDLNRDINNQELTLHNHPNEINANELQLINNKRAALIKCIQDSFPNLIHMTSLHQAPQLDLNNIMKKSDTASIIYFHWNRLNTYEYIISNRRVHLIEYFNSLSIKDSIDTYLRISQKGILRTKVEDTILLKLGKSLCQRWFRITPFKFNKRIIVIPDGPVHSISMAQVYNSQEDFVNSELTYSLSLASALRPKKEPIIKTLLAVAYGSAEESESFAGLPGTIKEIEQLQNHWKGKIIVLKGKEATKENFLKYAATADGLYLATHSQSDPSNRFKNRLVFHGYMGKNEFVTVGEIINSDMHPSVVVLSSCESGLGSYYRGSSNMSLIKAFKTKNPECLIFGYNEKINDDQLKRLKFKDPDYQDHRVIVYQ